MNHPLRENLEVYTDEGSAWIRCTKCSHVLCRSGENWKSVCRRRLVTPTKGGTLMKDLVGHFLLEQLYCPGCAVLLNTELVEEKHYGEAGRAK